MLCVDDGQHRPGRLRCHHHFPKGCGTHSDIKKMMYHPLDFLPLHVPDKPPSSRMSTESRVLVVRVPEDAGGGEVGVCLSRVVPPAPGAGPATSD